MSQFPWDHLKAETLRSICRDITGGTRLSRTKEEMTEFLQNVNEHGMKFDLPPAASASAAANRTSRRRAAPEDGDKDGAAGESTGASAGAGSSPKRRRISTRSTGDLKGIQTRGMKTGTTDSPGKWKTLSTRGKSGLANGHSAPASGLASAPARKRRTPAKPRAKGIKIATAAKRSARKKSGTSMRARRAGAAASQKQEEDTDAEGEQDELEDEVEQGEEEEKEKVVLDGVLIDTKPTSSAPRSQGNNASADPAAEPTAEAVVATVTVTDTDTGATSIAAVNGDGQKTEVVEAVIVNEAGQQVGVEKAAATNGDGAQEGVQVGIVTMEAPAPALEAGQQTSTLLPEVIVTAPSVVGSDTA